MEAYNSQVSNFIESFNKISKFSLPPSPDFSSQINQSTKSIDNPLNPYLIISILNELKRSNINRHNISLLIIAEHLERE
jgi:hypothetical protein